MERDEQYMTMALELARMAQGQTSPNPVVGAIIVKADRILGIGTHLLAGGPHAEIHALRMAGEAAKGSTLYVTLEPCSHYGKTPPCADAIITAGIERVVIAVEDPFPLVAGKGIAKLQAAGIAVEVGVMTHEAQIVNQVFFHYAKTGYPFVTLKLAATLDGYTATTAGDSFYITSEPARNEVHRLRSLVDGVIVGVETVKNDDPQLTVRIPTSEKHPDRIVFDSFLRIPLEAKIVNDGISKTIVISTDLAPLDKELALQEKGIEVVRFPSHDQQVPINLALEWLAKRGYLHLLLEGGNRLASNFMAEKFVHQVWIFHAPKLLGGGKGVLSWRNPLLLSEAITLANIEHRVLGEDVLTIGDIQMDGTIS